MTAPSTEVEPTLAPTEPGDHDLFKHYYDKRRFDLQECQLNGWLIQALCGKVWPGQRDPAKFPICPDCQKIVDYRSRD